MPIEVYSVGPRDDTGFMGKVSPEGFAEKIGSIYQQIREAEGRVIGSHAMRLYGGAGADTLFIVADIPSSDVETLA